MYINLYVYSTFHNIIFLLMTYKESVCEIKVIQNQGITNIGEINDFSETKSNGNHFKKTIYKILK